MEKPRRSDDEGGPERADGGALAPFRYPAFRTIWIANFGSNFGTVMQSVGAAWLMTGLTRSHQMVALVQASATLPIMLFGLLAGSLADNFDRRRLMIGSQLAMVAISAALSALTWLGLMTPWLLLALTLALGVGLAINSPAWQASVRQQVGREVLPQAVALNSISFNIARSLGPAAGGALISLGGTSAVFLLNALSRPPLLAVLLRWKPGHAAPIRQPTLPAVAEGVRFCAQDSTIRRVLAHGVAIGVGVSGYQALVPSMVRGPLHGNEVDFGVLLGLFGIGSVVAALRVDAARRRLGPGLVLAAAALLFAAGEVGVAGARSIPVAGAAALVAGAGWVSLLTSLNVVVQMLAPEAMAGRVLSVYQATTFGGMAVGSWLWGALADATSLATALRAGSLFLLAALIVLRFVAPMPGSAEMHRHRGR
jgi:MFS family permease